MILAAVIELHKWFFYSLSMIWNLFFPFQMSLEIYSHSAYERLFQSSAPKKVVERKREHLDLLQTCADFLTTFFAHASACWYKVSNITSRCSGTLLAESLCGSPWARRSRTDPVYWLHGTYEQLIRVSICYTCIKGITKNTIVQTKSLYKSTIQNLKYKIN